MLQDFFGKSYGAESAGSRAEHSDPRALDAGNNSANRGKPLYIRREGVTFDWACVRCGQAIGNTTLPEIVAQGYFAAKGIPTIGHIQLVKIIITSLNQNRNLKVGQIKGFDHAQLFAEIWQNNNDAGNPCAVILKKIRASSGFFV